MRKISYILSLVLIFCIPWEDSVTTTALGSLARVAGLLVAGCWALTILLEGRFRKPHIFHFLVLLFFCWNFLTAFWSRDILSTNERLQTYSQVFLLMLILWELFQEPGQLLAALQAYVVGAYVLIVSALYNYINGTVAVAYEGRFSATGVNAVDLALILLLGLPLALHLLFAGGGDKKRPWARLINISYIPVAIFTIILTGSRTSLVAILPFGMYVALSPQIKFNRKVLVFGGLLASVLILLPFVPPEVLTRLGTIGASIASHDLDGRVRLWGEAIALLAKHPILGIGGGTLYTTIGAAAHNTFVSVAAETGFIGFTLFLLILGLAIYLAVRMPGGRAGLWLAMLATWAIGVLSLSWEFRKETWLFLTFVMIESSFDARLQAEQVAVPAPRGLRQPLDVKESEISMKVAG